MTTTDKVKPTGRFNTRSELTCRIWSMHRQQIFPSYKVIAEECGTSPAIVRDVITSREGLEEYLTVGCLIGS